MHLAQAQIDSGDGRLVDDDVRLLAEEIPDRMRRSGGLEEIGRDLVEERLERVVVVSLSFRAAPTPAKPPPRTTTTGRRAPSARASTGISTSMLVLQNALSSNPREGSPG